MYFFGFLPGIVQMCLLACCYVIALSSCVLCILQFFCGVVIHIYTQPLHPDKRKKTFYMVILILKIEHFNNYYLILEVNTFFI
jgi:hypothetical protein